ncbi:MAG TPA: hypothetical protein VGR03_15385 [Candidatus Acidoferrum sp.]|nr:hypothetical protein [Candidatus Acidoferrum sp.]
MRKRFAVMAVATLAVLLAGCGPATFLFPLYTEGDKEFDARLLGKWKQVPKPGDKEPDRAHWIFKRNKDDGESYDFSLGSSDPKKGALLSRARLVRLKDYLFINFETPDLEKRGVTQAPFPAISANFIGRIRIEQDKVRLDMVEDTWIEKEFKAGMLPLSYISTSQGFVVTAKTEELRKFVVEHAEDDNIFSDSYELTREK